ncbi:ferredoxin [Streptomyces eurythermus]
MSGARPYGEFRTTVDRARCVGAGMCAGAAPDEFEVDTEGRSRLRRDAGRGGEALLTAAELCPVEAITIIDARSGRRVAPAD